MNDTDNKINTPLPQRILKKRMFVGVLSALVAVLIALPFTWNNGISLNVAFAIELFKIAEPEGFFATLSNLLLEASGWFAGVAGVVLNQAAKVAVIDMGGLIQTATIPTSGGAVSVIEIAWTVLRDLGNIVIIFSLLIIGIATILRISSYGMKALLVRLVVVALLINFSLFFTNIIIDTGNLLSFHFYNAITDSAVGCDPNDEFDGCISNAFVDKLKITSIYNLSNNSIDPGLTSENLDDGQIFLVGIMGSFFLLLTAFVFFAAGILLLIRFVVLVLLMILSPIAFAAMILPYTQSFASQWWRTLFSQVFFAPLLFLLFWISLVVITGLQSGINQATGINIESATFSGAFDGNSMAIITNFIIIMGFMVASLILARQAGAIGAKTVIGMGNSARRWGQGFVGRNTLSRLARRVDRGLAETKVGAHPLGQALRRNTTGALAGAKFQSGKSLTETEERDEKDLDKTFDRIKNDSTRTARFLSNIGAKNQKRLYGKLSARDRAAVEDHLPQPLQETLRASLAEEEREKTDKARKDAADSAQNRALRNSITEFAAGNPITLTKPGTSTPYSIQELMETLPDQEARKLPSDARKNVTIIQHMSTRQLHDLRTQGKLKPDEVAAIKKVIEGATPYGNKNAQKEYINQPAQAVFWT